MFLKKTSPMASVIKLSPHIHLVFDPIMTFVLCVFSFIHTDLIPETLKSASINSSKEVKDGLEIQMHDGKYVTFSIYNSYKIKQNTEFIANYIAQKANERN